LVKIKDIIINKLFNIENQINNSFDNLNIIINEISSSVKEYQNNDLFVLLNKHQEQIKQIDKKYIQDFIKISNYLKTKNDNIQLLIQRNKDLIDPTNTQIVTVEKNLEVLKDSVYTYNLLIFHSINMLTSLLEDDMLTFYEIYESLDKLNIFNSNWENEISDKLTKIDKKLDDLIFSIQKMEDSIIQKIEKLNYMNQMSFNKLNDSVSKELKNIDSSIRMNNLLSTIQTYQLYRINKNTKL
jgi:DNA repair ATPase RecN